MIILCQLGAHRRLGSQVLEGLPEAWSVLLHGHIGIRRRSGSGGGGAVSGVCCLITSFNPFNVNRDRRGSAIASPARPRTLRGR
jgi:hypothetical protein